ncbi:TonB-dependent receptor [Candidimonas nitroreducens]|uniref:TonB-dependent siderophore receptor n=1 Tax=Candidimonas nitroreducens TaxID=683354 RepID=A0A225MD96_9BURK|nr:TonB-dependent receptor [Candidimonas nitroreducens]OWT58203.1 TonB-dependent siderophore receptor [Candidimonas nitroreducens]
MTRRAALAANRADIPYPKARRPGPRPAALSLRAHLALAGGAALAMGCSAAAWAQGGAAAQTVAAQAARHYDIPSGPLGTVMAQFAGASGVLLAGSSELVQGRSSPGLSGTYTTTAAIQALLAGTGLEAVRQSNGTYSLRRAAGTGSTGVSVLAPVLVKGSTGLPDALPPAYAGGQVARGGHLGMLGNKSIMDTPFNVTSYTSALVENQQAVSIADVLANDPSVRTISYGLTNAAGAGDSFMIRGYSTQNAVLFDGVAGVAPSRTFPAGTAERIEVLKGPNALLNGMAPNGTTGGAINIVPKRADDQPLTRVTAFYQSRGQLGTHLDMGRRYGDDGQWGIRFNGIYSNGGTATDGQSVELGAATLGLDYRGARLRASLDVGHQTLNNQAPNGAGGFGIADGIGVPRPPDASRRVAQDWEYSKTRSDYVLGKLEYDISPDWTVYGAAGGSNNRFRYLSTDQYVTDLQGNAEATVYYWPDFWNYRSVQGGVRGSFQTGPLKHQINLNAAYLQQDHGYTVDYYGFASFNTNIYDQVSVPRPSTAGFSSSPPKTDTVKLPSLAFSDTISLPDDRFSITLGARHQRVKYITYDTSTGAGDTTYDESAVTPMLAFVFKPRDDLSLYGNYIEGLSQGDTAPIGTTNAGQVFSPIKTKQYEVGAKYDFGRYATTLALFQIQKPSGLAVSNGDGTYTYQMNGEQRNRGVELNVFGEVAHGLRLLGGVAYTQATLAHTADGVNDGRQAPNVPRWQLNLGGEYDLQAVPGLTLTARMISTSPQYLDAQNSARIPGWTRWDVGARYKTTAMGRPLTLRAGIENLFGRDYWASGSGSWIYLGSPRIFMLSASMEF